MGHSRAATMMLYGFVYHTSIMRSCTTTAAFVVGGARMHAAMSHSCSQSNRMAIAMAATTTNGNETPQRTRYTIDDTDCPPVADSELNALIVKHCNKLPLFWTKRPIAKHTKVAFGHLEEMVREFSSNSNNSSSTTDNADARSDGIRCKIILDSGCGTGRSTRLLSKMYPDHLVIGVDRSFTRLSTNTKSSETGIDADSVSDCESKGDTDSDSGDDRDEDDIGEEEGRESKRPYIEQLSPNCIIVRAELNDFWRCCIINKWPIERHYILYPNPYPKKNRIKQRFYGHPGFPILLGASCGNPIIVRSNWQGFLKEFAMSVQCADAALRAMDEDAIADMKDPAIVGEAALPDLDVLSWASAYVDAAKKGPSERLDKSVGMTNFERKFDRVGERTYELILSKGIAE